MIKTKLLMPLILSAAVGMSVAPSASAFWFFKPTPQKKYNPPKSHKPKAKPTKPGKKPTKAIPELSAGAAGAPLALVAGGLSVLAGRRRRKAA